MSTNYNRKDFLKNAAMTAGGLMLGGLASPTAAQSNRSVNIKQASKVKSVVFINMQGGMSHVDTLDPRRSQSKFGTVRTSIPGIEFGEPFSRTAREMKRISLIRSTYSEDGDHRMASHLMHSGYRVTESMGWPDIPSLGSVIAYAGTKTGQPYFPSLITMGSRGGMIGQSGFLGVRYGGFHIGNFKKPVNHLNLSYGRISTARQEMRGRMLDMLNEGLESRYSSTAATKYKQMFEASLEFMNSERLDVFNLKAESARTRERFGENWAGQALLMAKRLAEAGVPFIEISIGGWDTHRDNQKKITKIMKDADPAIAAFLKEAGSSGLLDSTLFVLTSEFGRTPVVGGRDGRDHHSRCWSTLIGGGGLPAGQVIGESNKNADKPKRGKRKVHLRDLAATILTVSGIKTEEHLTNGSGRPFPLASPASKIITELTS